MSADANIRFVWARTLGKVGVPLQGSFTLNNDTLADILSRNTGPLENRSVFVLPSATTGSPHPFPVVGFTLLGT